MYWSIASTLVIKSRREEAIEICKDVVVALESRDQSSRKTPELVAFGKPEEIRVTLTPVEICKVD